jgi:diaminopimelate decarboxylase
VADVVGSLCRNNDKLTVERRLPKFEIGDVLIQHDVGVYAVLLGYNYND